MSTHTGHRPQHGAYFIYDLSSPVFSNHEISAIFSPNTTASRSADGWGPLIGSRISHITSRDPAQPPYGLCIGEFTSASVAAPSATHGIPQIFAPWKTHPASRRFREMIASRPVIQPAGVGPAEILKSALDEYTNSTTGKDPLALTWVLKFLLVGKGDVDWGALQREELPANLVRQVMLVCVTREGWRREDVGRRISQFGGLFDVEVVVVSSIA